MKNHLTLRRKLKKKTEKLADKKPIKLLRVNRRKLKQKI